MAACRPGSSALLYDCSALGRGTGRFVDLRGDHGLPTHHSDQTSVGRGRIMSSDSKGIIAERWFGQRIEPLALPRLEIHPPGPDGIVYGFLFRLIGGAAMVLMSGIVVLIAGAVN